MSRELDARVAEKVMGLYPVRHCGKLYEFARKDPNAPLNIVRLSHYSTDIRAAFEVVEKLGEDGWIITLHRDLNWNLTCFPLGTAAEVEAQIVDVAKVWKDASE